MAGSVRRLERRGRNVEPLVLLGRRRLGPDRGDSRFQDLRAPPAHGGRDRAGDRAHEVANLIEVGAMATALAARALPPATWRRSEPLGSDVNAELAEIDDRGLAPSGCVGGEGKRKGHPVGFPERLSVAHDVVVAGRRLDGEAGGFEPADELADVLPHRRLELAARPSRLRRDQRRARSPVIVARISPDSNVLPSSSGRTLRSWLLAERSRTRRRARPLARGCGDGGIAPYAVDRHRSGLQVRIDLS